jgi:predicted nuclease of predicted toxin-antitoxin system
MKFKLDQNLGERTRSVFRDAGHDTETIRDEGLSGATDDTIFAHCRAEGRCLVTLDLDFSNVLRYPPYDTPGIIVLKPPRDVSLAVLVTLARQVVHEIERRSVAGSLWIVEPGRIRIRDRTNGSIA